MGTTLKIFGREYNIKGDVSSSYMEEVACYVDSKFHELANTCTSSLDMAILAALNIADELFQERELQNKTSISLKRSIALLEVGLSKI